jgi:hypothetical protein
MKVRVAICGSGVEAVSSNSPLVDRTNFDEKTLS